MQRSGAHPVGRSWLDGRASLSQTPASLVGDTLNTPLAIRSERTSLHLRCAQAASLRTYSIIVALLTRAAASCARRAVSRIGRQEIILRLDSNPPQTPESASGLRRIANLQRHLVGDNLPSAAHPRLYRVAFSRHILPHARPSTLVCLIALTVRGISTAFPRLQAGRRATHYCSYTTLV